MSTDFGNIEIGNSLRERKVQYVANRDDYGIWRILDTWHPEMTTIQLTDDLDIPDDSDAVLILKEGQFLALMHEVEVQNYMPAANGEKPLFNIADEGLDLSREEELLKTIAELQQEVADLNIANIVLLEGQTEVQYSSDDHEYRMRKLDLYETMSNKGNIDLQVAELINNSGA
jgi:hypothetical protein